MKLTKEILREIIKEELEKLDEESYSKKVGNLYFDFTELSADEVETFFKLLSQWYLENKSELDNMDAKGISKDLSNAYKKVNKRTGK